MTSLFAGSEFGPTRWTTLAVIGAQTRPLFDTNLKSDPDLPPERIPPTSWTSLLLSRSF